MATDSGEGPGTDFILSYRAYGKMAVPRMASLLYSLGVVDVEYRRISCHEAANLVIKIVEHSNYPWYLAIVPLKQGGANDILSIEVYEVNNQTLSLFFVNVVKLRGTNVQFGWCHWSCTLIYLQEFKNFFLIKKRVGQRSVKAKSSTRWRCIVGRRPVKNYLWPSPAVSLSKFICIRK